MLNRSLSGLKIVFQRISSDLNGRSGLAQGTFGEEMLSTLTKVKVISSGQSVGHSDISLALFALNFNHILLKDH